MDAMDDKMNDSRGVGMSEKNAAVDWLMEFGSPVIRYRLACEVLREPEIAGKRISRKEFAEELLQIQRIDELLRRMDEHGSITEMDSLTLRRIHNGGGLESLIGLLLEYGLRSGVAPFDARMQAFRQYVDNEFVRRALKSPCGQDVAVNWSLFIASLFASFFLRGGYRHAQIIEFAKERIHAIYKIASRNDFNIYLNDSELAGYPKRPGNWAEVPVIRPEYDPGCNDTPLPFIHDVYTMAYFPRDLLGPGTSQEIEAIVGYILDERFQALHTGYGLVHYRRPGRYYACGWSPSLACCSTFDNEYETRLLLHHMELMSRFGIARRSAWFRNCRNYLEQYRTARGTYCFPAHFFRGGKEKEYKDGLLIGVADKSRKPLALEIESTFRVLLIDTAADRQDAAEPMGQTGNNLFIAGPGGVSGI